MVVLLSFDDCHHFYYFSCIVCAFSFSLSACFCFVFSPAVWGNLFFAILRHLIFFLHICCCQMLAERVANDLEINIAMKFKFLLNYEMNSKFKRAL